MNECSTCARIRFRRSPRRPAGASKRDMLKPEVIWEHRARPEADSRGLSAPKHSASPMIARRSRVSSRPRTAADARAHRRASPSKNRYCRGVEPEEVRQRCRVARGIVYAITLVCCPALSLPCGFTAGGVAVGRQVGAAPPRRGPQLLAGAKVAEVLWACAGGRSRRSAAGGSRLAPPEYRGKLRVGCWRIMRARYNRHRRQNARSDMRETVTEERPVNVGTLRDGVDFRPSARGNGPLANRGPPELSNSTEYGTRTGRRRAPVPRASRTRRGLRSKLSRKSRSTLTRK